MKEKQASKINWRMIPGIIVGIGIIGIIFYLMSPNEILSSYQHDSDNSGVAQSLYESNCASCHGLQGQGHIELNAPALDHSEHAWHHPDEQIIMIIREGGFNMPPVGADLSNEEIENIFAYMKGWWTEEQKEYQGRDIGES